MYIHHTLQSMNDKEPLIGNNQHVEQGRIETEYEQHKYGDLICIENILFQHWFKCVYSYNRLQTFIK